MDRYLGEKSINLDDSNNCAIVNDFSAYANHQALSIKNIVVQPNKAIFTGSQLSITINFYTNHCIPLLAIGLRFYDPSGIEKIFRLGTFPYSKWEELRDVTGNTKVECRIGKIPLVGGMYYIKLIASIPGGEKLIEIDKAIILKVNSLKYYGGTIEIDRLRGLVVVDEVEWIFSNNNC